MPALPLTTIQRQIVKLFTAKDGEQAIERYAQHHAEIDFVMLAVAMPNKGAKEVGEYLDAVGTLFS